MRRTSLAAWFAVALAVGGCGSHHGATASSAGGSTATGTTGGPTTTGAAGTGTVGTGTTGTATTGTATTGTTGTATTGTATTGTGTATGTSGSTTSTSTTGGSGTSGGHHRLVPADFTIGRGETVNPPIVVIPSSATVFLTIASRDGRAHTVLVRSAPPRSIRVPPGGRASLRLSGLADGNYVIDVDNGAATAQLQIGSGPAP